MSETIKMAKAMAKKYMEKDIPCFTMGPPGVGKSMMWKQIADEQGIKLIDLRLSQMDPVDLRGLPRHINAKNVDYTTWARPDFWPVPERDGERGIILFDELSDAGKAMQSAAYQIVLDGYSGPHEIPKGWYRAAAGNSRAHKAAAQSISSALASRFGWIDVEPDLDCFIEYGLTFGLHHYIVGFLKSRPGLLHSMEGGDLRSFPSPRTWQRASLFAEEEGSIRLRLFQGLVGAGAAGEFDGFMRTLDLPTLDEVLKAPKKCRIPTQPSSKYALSSMLARFADRNNLMKVWEYIQRDEFGKDFQICCMLDATKRSSDLTEHKAFVEFANANSDLVL